MDLDVERCAHCHRVLVRDECPVCASGVDAGHPPSRHPRARSEHPPSMRPPSVHPSSLHPSSMPPRGRSEHPQSFHPDGRPKSIAPAFATLRPPEAPRSPWWGRLGLLVVLFGAFAVGWTRCGDRPAWRPLAVDVDGPKTASAPRVVFFLHGNRDSNADVAWVAPALRRAGVPAEVAIVFVQAPYAVGWGRHWGEVTAERKQAGERVREAITAALGSSTLAPDRITIAGFGQGAQVATEVAAADQRIGALAILSPCVLMPVPEGLKVLVARGDGDRECRPEHAAEMIKELEKQKQDVTSVAFDDGHVIAPDAIDALAKLVGGPVE